MHDGSPFAPHVAFRLGPVPIAEEVLVTWALMAILTAAALLLRRRLADRPGSWQTAVEAVVLAISDQVRDVVRRDPAPYLPLIATLFVFIATANLSALLPGVRPPTGHAETPAALAAIVFVAAHAYGIRAQGLGRYLKGYLQPSPLLLPLNVLGELTRTFSLGVRLFGNVMSHEFIIALLLGLAGLLVPVPFMALTILIGLIQAYIFTMLATVYVGAAIGAIERG